MAIINGTPKSETLKGTSKSDTILGDFGNDTIRGLGGNDDLSGEEGNDKVYGGDGNDSLNDDITDRNSGNDRFYGEKGNDVLDPGEGNDFLSGGPDNDRLIGGEGKDSLEGGKGNDILWGGSDNDKLTGGSGSDVFAAGYTFFPDNPNDAPGRDTITDFSQGDKIELFVNYFSPEDPPSSFFLSFDDLDTNNSGAINGKDEGVTIEKGALVIDVQEVLDPAEQDYGSAFPGELVVLGVTSLGPNAIATHDYDFI